MSQAKDKTKQKTSNSTSRIIHTINDLLLLNLKLCSSFLTDSPGDFSMAKSLERVDKILVGLDKKQARQAAYRLKEHNWINKDLGLTKQGRKRLNSLTPTLLSPGEWDGSWYLVIFDIPESKRSKRDILRNKLKQLNFGQLHRSVWVFPVNYLPVLEELVEQYSLEPYVVLCEAEKIGRGTPQDFSENICGLNQLNQKYQELISEWREAETKPEEFSCQMKYLQIVAEDPQLPAELLPEDWKGDVAHRLMQDCEALKLISE